MDEFISKQMAIDALDSGELLTLDSNVCVEIEGFGDPFYVTSAEGGGNSVALSAVDTARYPLLASEIRFCPTFTEDEEAPIVFADGEELYLFTEMDIRNEDGIVPDLYLYSDGTTYIDSERRSADEQQERIW